MAISPKDLRSTMSRYLENSKPQPDSRHSAALVLTCISLIANPDDQQMPKDRKELMSVYEAFLAG